VVLAWEALVGSAQRTISLAVATASLAVLQVVQAATTNSVLLQVVLVLALVPWVKLAAMDSWDKVSLVLATSETAAAVARSLDATEVVL
jgi:hypothetical protein